VKERKLQCGEHCHPVGSDAVYLTKPKIVTMIGNNPKKRNPRDPAHRKLLAGLKRHFESDERAPTLREVTGLEAVPGKPGLFRPVKRKRRAVAKIHKRRKNPPYWYIHIQRSGRGPVMIYNGRSFTNQPDDKPFPFASAQAAKYKARHLLGKFHDKLSAYKIWVSDMVYGASHESRRVNPSQRQKLDEAAKKLEDFTGHEATQVERVRARSEEKTGLVVGELDLIGYRVAREGVEGGRLTRYAHKFRKGSRPLLAVSTDGKQLHVVGGQYEFTEAGIEDR
jgi:hypothetical protein